MRKWIYSMCAILVCLCSYIYILNNKTDALKETVKKVAINLNADQVTPKPLSLKGTQLTVNIKNIDNKETYTKTIQLSIPKGMSLASDADSLILKCAIGNFYCDMGFETEKIEVKPLFYSRGRITWKYIMDEGDDWDDSSLDMSFLNLNSFMERQMGVVYMRECIKNKGANRYGMFLYKGKVPLLNKRSLNAILLYNPDSSSVVLVKSWDSDAKILNIAVNGSAIVVVQDANYAITNSMRLYKKYHNHLQDWLITLNHKNRTFFASFHGKPYKK